MKENSWAVAGRGNIGSELMRSIAAAPGLGLRETPEFIITSEGVMAPNGTDPYGVADLRDVPPDLMPDALFLACPTTNDGQPAMTFAEHALRSGKRVVTAEKGAISKFYPKLDRLSGGFNRLGISATVGGGSLLMSRARSYLSDHPGEVSSITGVLNGTLQATLSHASSEYGEGTEPEDAIAWSQSQGFAEPGNAAPFDVLRAEIDGDVAKKMLIFLRHVMGMNNLTVGDLGGAPTSDETIRRAFAGDMRYVMSLSNLAISQSLPEDDLLGGVVLRHQGWLIRSGFQTIGSTASSKLLSSAGPTNGLTIELGPHGRDGNYTISGPGAGARPTVNAMLYDNQMQSELIPDPALASRMKGYRGGKPRRILTQAEQAYFVVELHRANVATLQAAGLRLVFSGGVGYCIDAAEKLMKRHGVDRVLYGPGLLPDEVGDNAHTSMGVWIPEGDGLTFALRGQDLDLVNGHWLLRGGPDQENTSNSLSIFS